MTPPPPTGMREERKQTGETKRKKIKGEKGYSLRQLGSIIIMKVGAAMYGLGYILLELRAQFKAPESWAAPTKKNKDLE